MLLLRVGCPTCAALQQISAATTAICNVVTCGSHEHGPQAVSKLLSCETLLSSKPLGDGPNDISLENDLVLDDVILHCCRVLHGLDGFVDLRLRIWLQALLNEELHFLEKNDGTAHHLLFEAPLFARDLRVLDTMTVALPQGQFSFDAVFAPGPQEEVFEDC